VFGGNVLTHVFTLRDVEESDHSWLIELHNDPVVLNHMTHPEPITEQSHKKWWKSICEDSNQERFIFCVDGESVGITKFKFDFWNERCELGADIYKAFRGKGFAKPMWKLMLEKCSERNVRAVFLTTIEFNEIAIKIYRDIGFVDCGRFPSSLRREDKWYDEIFMTMKMNEFKA
jgi:RimJ/RimL family protein N-acetyltransferase